MIWEGGSRCEMQPVIFPKGSEMLDVCASDVDAKS